MRGSIVCRPHVFDNCQPPRPSSAWLFVLIAVGLFVFPAPRSEAKTYTFNFRNISASPIEIQLYADGRANVWPAADQVWTVQPGGRVNRMRISCRSQEKICFGAWVVGRTDISYGVGRGKAAPCADCCFVCTGRGTKLITLNPRNLAQYAAESTSEDSTSDPHRPSTVIDEGGPEDDSPFAPSFACEDASLNQAEVMICSNRELSDADNALHEIYTKVVQQAGSAEAERQDQRIFIERRNECGLSFPCLDEAYEARIKTLKDIAGGDIRDASPVSADRSAKIFKDCEKCPEMIVIEPGKFLMGASREDRKFADAYTLATELPQHEVDISYQFAIAKFEVTVAEFAAYAEEAGASTGGDCEIRTPDLGPDAGAYVGTLKEGASHTPPSLFVVADASFRRPGSDVTDNHPATCISRREAKAYLDWLGKKTGKPYRFPTEAEWEYAARAGSQKPFHYGRGLSDLCRYGNFADKKSPYHARVMAQCAEKPSPLQTSPVGAYEPNAWGLYDVIGNAFEFVEDCASDNYNNATTDGSPYGRDTGCETFMTRSYFFDSLGTALRSAARCSVVDWDGRSNGLTIRAAVSLDETAWDRE
jgi:formylglycine-generating enzyme required for sulfatase activity